MLILILQLLGNCQLSKHLKQNMPTINSVGYEILFLFPLKCINWQLFWVPQCRTCNVLCAGSAKEPTESCQNQFNLCAWDSKQLRVGYNSIYSAFHCFEKQPRNKAPCNKRVETHLIGPNLFWEMMWLWQCSLWLDVWLNKRHHDVKAFPASFYICYDKWWLGYCWFLWWW